MKIRMRRLAAVLAALLVSGGVAFGQKPDEPSGRMGGGRATPPGGMAPGMYAPGGMGPAGMGGCGAGPGLPGMGVGDRLGASRSRRQREPSPSGLPPEVLLEMALRADATDRGVPSLEELLNKAMQIDPDIVAARAEVQKAEAALERARRDLARRIINARAGWEVEHRAAKHFEKALREQPKNAELLHSYLKARARLANIEAMAPYLKLLPGGPGHVGFGRAVPSVRPGRAPERPAPGPQPAENPINDRLHKALQQPVTLEFIETPLFDVMDYLRDACKVQFVFDGGSAVDEDLPVTLNLEGVPLKAALQAIEDTCGPVRFVVREYGILVTDEQTAARSGRGRSLGSGGMIMGGMAR